MKTSTPIMNRTKQVDKKQLSANNLDLHVLASALVARAGLVQQLGQQQYGGDRNVNQALGYLQTIKFNDFYARYVRQDIAKAIIDRPCKATWQGDLCLEESTEAEITSFEEAWETLRDDLNLKSIFSRLDRITGLGKYGILLLGFSDVKANEDFQKPIAVSNGIKLLYTMPFSEGSALIQTYVNDPTDKRYGKPETYNISLQQSEGGSTINILVHHTRVIHVVEDKLESEVEGAPRLEVVFNRLMDLEKLVGGDAEMFWRGARPGYSGKVDKDFQMTPETKDGLKDMINEYEHNLRRMLVTEGVDLTALAQQIADPASHVDIQLQMISAVTGIPKRILVGSERGELSSGQDADEWDSFVQNRRDEYVGPYIVKPFVDLMIKLKILPTPTDGYNIKWSDLFAESEAERVKIGAQRSTALKDYLTNPMAESIVPPKAFMEFFLGFNGDQIDLINEMVDTEMGNMPTDVPQEIIPVEPTNTLTRTK